MSDKQKVRWGILGAARINRRMIPGLQEADNAEVVAIASRDEAKGREAAAKWNIPTLYASYEALLADPQIDAVYVPLPNSLHVEWAIRAVQAGKHALSEKPLAIRPEDVTRLAEAARQAGRLAMEGFMYRFHPQQARVRELLAAGEIGPAQVIRGTYAFVIDPSKPNIRLDPAQGGGATWDVGSYGINLVRWMFGTEPQRVWAEATRTNGLDTAVAAVLDFGDGRRAVLDYGMSYGRRSFYEILGTKGTLSVENMWQEPDVPAQVYLRKDSGLTTFEIEPQNHFRLQAEAFSRAILEGGPSPYPLEDSLLNTRVCTAVLRSIEAHQSVSVE